MNEYIEMITNLELPLPESLAEWLEANQGDRGQEPLSREELKRQCDLLLDALYAKRKEVLGW